MENKLQNTQAVKNTYIAWSLYTGSSNATGLWDNSRWITGQWNGADDIKIDIDLRIDAIIRSFRLARESLSKRQKTSATGYFVIPEFYFHCKHGPYANIQIEGEYPYEYILSSIRKKLDEEKAKLLENEIWMLCIGTALTCNVRNIPDFLGSYEVKQRLNKLNNIISKRQPKSRYSSPEKYAYIKAMGYMNKGSLPLKSMGAGNAQPGWEEEINSLMIQYRADPLCVVRNRGAVFKINSTEKTECVRYEKQNESTVDLTMGILSQEGKLETGNMITEWIAGYPLSSIISGDKNPQASPTAARISINDPLWQPQKNLELGVEVCLDHRLNRLRRTVGMTKKNGAAADNAPLDVQLITSGGMQILDQSVASGPEGAIFNADGCDPILTEYTSEGKQIIADSGVFKGIACGVYISSAQTMRENNSHKYYSHSQLSFRYGNKEIGSYDYAKGINNTKGATYDKDSEANPILDSYTTPKIVAVPCVNFTSPLYAAESGELHIYT